MLSKSSILARPGWSPLNFESLLGEPDDCRNNFGYAKARLYTLERVLAAEASPQFQETKQRVKVERFSVPGGLLLPDNDFAAALAGMPIEVIVFSIGRVREGAIGHYNASLSANFVTRRSDGGLLNRIMVEYARDTLTRYDRDFEARASAAGASTVIRAIRITLYHAIASTYPTLSRECFAHLDCSA